MTNYPVTNASHYLRREATFDRDLQAHYQQQQKGSYHVLDLACGEGGFLKKQIQSLGTNGIHWYGLDLSPDLLLHAKQLLADEWVMLSEGSADSLPYPDESMNYISNRYSFHHFLNKRGVIREIWRVLKPGGMLKMTNRSVFDEANSWLYLYFPNAFFEDCNRYWSREMLFGAMKQMGFHVQIHLKVTMKQEPLRHLLYLAEMQAFSSLTRLSGRDYQAGLSMMREKLRENPKSRIQTEQSEMVLYARK